MLINNYIRLVIPSHSRNEAFARTAVSAFAAQLDPTIEEINDIKAAVSEAVTNCIVHAYPDHIADIEIIARILEQDTFYIRIKDKGLGIADIKQAMLPLFSTCAEGERAGLGFAVMESFMDKLRVTSRTGKGTSVIMTKRVISKS
ncbi:MAG: anti-sigma F factor [Oscillospiraceae bacterium]|jgi:stage II sporulation protein AB (anti-sigma F factor)|nr:anti-sigma F factor [Oscillospiraceae bacterium]